MKSVQVTRRSTARRSGILAAGALSAIVGLASIDSALAAGTACAANTYAKIGEADCTACPVGTTAAVTPTAGTDTFCEGVAAGYYGTAGDAASAHATVTQCPTIEGVQFTLAAFTTGTKNREDCSGSFTQTHNSGSVSTSKDVFIKVAGASVSGAYTVHACPVGTEAAAAVTIATGTSNNAATTCSSLSAEYYGTAGVAGTSHATDVVRCPFGSTGLAAGTSTRVVSSCSAPSCTGAAFAVSGQTCQCAAGYYGSPLDANKLTIGAPTQGCTACGNAVLDSGNVALTSAAGSTTRAACSASFTYGTDSASDDLFVATTGASAAGAYTLNACPEGTKAATPVFAAAGTGNNAATKCTVIKPGYSGTVAAGAHATVAKCAKHTFATEDSSVSRTCTACPAGFATGTTYATGSAARETCVKQFVAGTDAASTDVYVSSTANSASGVFTMNACPAGTKAATAITAATGSSANTASFCSIVKAGYYGSQGDGTGHANVFACPDNSSSAEGSDDITDCSCNTGYSASSTAIGTCVASTPAASTPTAAEESAGAAMPIAAAVAAMAMPLLI